MHTADFVFTYESSQVARVVEHSVRVEAGDVSGDRTRASIERDGPTVTVTVDARDLTALRAGANTWLTLVEVAETTVTGRPVTR